jgi:hypothetical protein
MGEKKSKEREIMLDVLLLLLLRGPLGYCFGVFEKSSSKNFR